MPAITLTDWKSSLRNALPEKWQQRFQVNSRNQLLTCINRTLLVFDDSLVDLATGRSVALAQQGAVQAEVLADAASSLLTSAGHQPDSGSGGTDDGEPAAVLLLLPSVEFLATRFEMPGVNRENLKSALSLQAYALLPGYEETLALAVNSDPVPPEVEETAVWLPAERINSLFEAFAARGVFLAGIMPRLLAAADAVPGNCVLLEKDAQMTVQLEFLTDSRSATGFIARWLQIPNADLQQPEFQAQWQEQTADLVIPPAPVTDISSAEDYQRLLKTPRANPHYSYQPAGAATVIASQAKGKRMKMATVAAGVVVVLAMLPFLLQSLNARLQLAELADLRETSMSARADQARVRQFEEDWGVLTEYPRQSLPEVLVTLQSVISPGYLTSLEVEEGAVSLEGDSADPQSLLEQLEQNPLFTEVDFARAISNQRYYIDLRLAETDFEAYLDWYFPDAQ